MADVTVRQLSRVVGSPVEKVLEQLKEAGLEQTDAEDIITDSEKLTLLTYLRSERENNRTAKKVTLKRKRVSEYVLDENGEREFSVEERSKKVENQEHIKGPQVFISYSYDSPEHEAWVEQLAIKLRSHGVDAILDRWVLHPGDPITEFMEKSIADSDFVLIVCTEQYKLKSDSRKGRVGYEEAIISSEIFNANNHRKFIPLIVGGSTRTIPTTLHSKYFLDLSGGKYETSYKNLLLTLYNQRDEAPSLGKPPEYIS